MESGVDLVGHSDIITTWIEGDEIECKNFFVQTISTLKRTDDEPIVSLPFLCVKLGAG